MKTIHFDKTGRLDILCGVKLPKHTTNIIKLVTCSKCKSKLTIAQQPLCTTAKTQICPKCGKQYHSCIPWCDECCDKENE